MAVEAFGNPENKVKFCNNIHQYDSWDNVKRFLPQLLNVAEETLWAFSNFFMSAFIYADPDEFPCDVKGRFLKWLRKSAVVEWLIDRFFATHRKHYKQKNS
ncbi:MAG: hypothetical protein GWN16_11545 [Calditrichae bacterium]|nr:hypothetical protein [Calditrichia bacterium]